MTRRMPCGYAQHSDNSWKRLVTPSPNSHLRNAACGDNTHAVQYPSDLRGVTGALVGSYTEGLRINMSHHPFKHPFARKEKDEPHRFLSGLRDPAAAVIMLC
jgi:hypothetical protein